MSDWGVAEARTQAPPDRARPAVLASSVSFTKLDVAGSGTEHGSGGEGLPVLFLHGWGIGPRSYAGPLVKVAEIGCRVLAPALPGFGGTASLSRPTCTFSGYADWVNSYLQAVGVVEPVVVVGHSFGAGVALQLAHDHPERVRAAVLCNGVGGASWSASSERPIWEWGMQLGSDLLALQSVVRVLPAVIGQALPNIVQNPVAMWRVGDVVRRADLRREARVLRRRNVPVTVVWSDRDRLVSHGNFHTMCQAAGVNGIVVPGHHSWLIAEPARFADVVLRALVEAGVVEEALVQLTA